MRLAVFRKFTAPAADFFYKAPRQPLFFSNSSRQRQIF
jgi:hypothetical protein